MSGEPAAPASRSPCSFVDGRISPVQPSSALSRFLLLGHGPGGTAATAGRDARIDVIRGLALLVIFINHMPGNVVAAWMPHNFGFSDGADAFVLLAGISATLAYGSLIERRGLAVGALKIGGRLWTLYIAHIALFIVVCGVVAAAVTRTQNPLYIEAINIQPFFSDTLAALIDVLTLRYQPSYLDILPLYIVLLAMLPLLWVMARIAPVVALSASVSLYAASWWLELALPNMSTGGSWFFNPFAWQLLFTVGMITGHGALRGVALPRSPWISVAAVAIVLFGLVSAAPWAVISGFEGLILPDAWRLDLDKTNLSLWRLAHAVSLAYLVAAHVPKTAAWLGSAGARLLEQAGRHSLPLFCFGVILSLLGTFAFTEIGRGPLMQVAVNAIGIALLLATAQMLEWYRKAVAKVPAKTQAGASEVKAA